MAMAMRDPYDVLGVKRNATEGEIKKAFRSLAKKFHPDTHGNDPAKSKRFQEINAAYEVVGDKEKRARFDRGEIDAEGHARGFDPRAQGFGGFQGGQQEGFPGGFDFRSGGGQFRAEDIFADILGGFGGGGGARRRATRGEDLQMETAVSLEEAASGATRRVVLTDGKQIEVKIPAGVKDDQQIRLKGKGGEGRGGGPAGDVLITVKLAPHAQFSRDGLDLKLDLAVSLKEAVLGGKVEVPTLSGAVTLTVPPHSNSGQVLRLRGKGLPVQGGTAGDLYVRLVVALPTPPDPALDAFVKDWSSAYNPRGKGK